MKNFIIAIALMFSATSFAQFSQGTWTFGVGTDFTTSDNTANASYFVMDGIMVSLEFDMTTDNGLEGEAEVLGQTNWGIGARYYIGEDGLWAGAKVSNWTDPLGVEEDGMDMSLMVGCSKAFMENIWFEPCVMMEMPAADDSMTLGLGMGFRFAF